jgi:CheY-like chemotaxis protein
MILGRVSSLGFFCHLILIIFGFQVQSKLGLSGASKSLPKVLEMAGVKKNVSPGKGQTGLALDVHGVPVSRNNLEHAVSINSSTPTRQPEEQEFINLSNLGPAASPGSSSASSTVGSPRITGSLTPHHLPVGTDPLSLEKFADEGNGNHVVDIAPAALSDPSNDPGPLNRTSEPKTELRPTLEDPRALLEQGDRSVKTAEPDPPLHGNEPGAAQAESDVVAPAPTASASRPVEARRSTRNARKPAANANRLGPSNALAGIRILLAEDTPVLARVATIMLEKMGARVVAVADGLQAVETISRSRGGDQVDDEAPSIPSPDDQFDLVLMDCQVRACASFVPMQSHAFPCSHVIWRLN